MTPTSNCRNCDAKSNTSDMIKNYHRVSENVEECSYECKRCGYHGLEIFYYN